MKSISKILVAIILLLSFNTSNAQIKNAITETVKVYGNCGMCETKIEKAGNVKKISKVDWDKDTQMATLIYDSKLTNQDEILKRIALAGYDSDKFLAPVDVYNNLPGCCQYDRNPIAVNKETVNTNLISENKTVSMQETNQLKAVFDNYFEVKEALVKTDKNVATAKAITLLSAINAVKMDKLEMDVHLVWMKVSGSLKADVENISKNTDIAKQRSQFNSLSKNIYALLKVSRTETPTYYQFCPMANDGKGANWLSKENAIKNPYYGSMMMTCGKTVETIK